MNQLLQLDENFLSFIMQATGRWHFFDILIVIFAQYLVYAVPLLLLIFWFWPTYNDIRKKDEQKNIASALVAAIFSWLAICQSLIHIFKRTRPDLALLNHKELFFHRPTYSFPSDHASMLFGLTFYFYFSGEHKKGHLFLVLAIIISVFRVFAGVHFPLDILAGVVVGFIGALIIKMLDKYLKGFWEIIIVFLKKHKLA